MRDSLYEECADADAVVMAAAVSDWRPAEVADQKVKKGDDDTWSISLVKNPDLIAGVIFRKARQSRLRCREP